MGQLKRAATAVLLADTDVLIDYRDSDQEVLKLIRQHVGAVAGLSPVLDEVRGLTRADCMRLSICVVGVATGRLLRAGVVDSSVSFNDRVGCSGFGARSVVGSRADRIADQALLVAHVDPCPSR